MSRLWLGFCGGGWFGRGYHRIRIGREMYVRGGYSSPCPFGGFDWVAEEKKNDDDIHMYTIDGILSNNRTQ